MKQLSDYFQNVFAHSRRRFACRASDSQEFAPWRKAASSALRHILGLNTIADQNGVFHPSVVVHEPEECDGGYIRAAGHSFRQNPA